jgi:hypothetical protein
LPESIAAIVLAPPVSLFQRVRVEHDLTIYQFSREKVERIDFRHFLGIYGKDKLPRGPRLRAMMNTLTFAIAGYDEDPREIPNIPEVRSFYAAFREAWPFWLYFCNLDTDSMRTMVLCCLPSISAMQVDRNPDMVVAYDPVELIDFLHANFGPMNLMCERGCMTEERILLRSKEVFNYFGLPFSSERG